MDHLDLAQDSTATLGTSSHHNVITIRGSSIASINYNGTFAITHGQPSQVPPEIKQNGDTWTVDFYCGRKKSSPVANGFNGFTGGANHARNPYSSGDRTPAELNFYGGVNVGLKVGTIVYPVTLYLAQGSNVWGNNWWVGGKALAYKGSTPVIIPVVSLSGQILEVFELKSSSANTFSLTPWMGAPAPTKDQPDWLARVADTTAINAINLPGTHDSAAIRRFPFVTPYTCHYTSLTRQALSGVRLFDIRLSVHESNGQFSFMTCHGDLGDNEYQSFPSAMDEFKQFLVGHPKEFLAVSLKVDDWNGIPDASKPAAFNALYALLQGYPIVGRSDLPTLGQVRGKIYLLNRLNNDVRFGPPIGWNDATPGQAVPANPPSRTFPFYVQDKYKGLSITGAQAEKFDLWKVAESQASASQVLLNYASATWFGVIGVYIMGDVLGWLGAKSAANRPSLLGWSLFDYEDTAYSTNLYGSLTVVEIVIDSNFKTSSAYPNAFQVTQKDEL